MFAAGRITQPGGPRVGDPRCRRLATYSGLAEYNSVAQQTGHSSHFQSATERRFGYARGGGDLKVFCKLVPLYYCLCQCSASGTVLSDKSHISLCSGSFLCPEYLLPGCVFVPQHRQFLKYSNLDIQGEHKFFPRLQTFITRKLRGIQTYFFLPLLKLVSKILCCMFIVMLQLHIFAFHVVFL